MGTAIKQRELEDHGFFCGARDPRLNTDYAGAFMVVDPADYATDHSLPTKDGSDGPWCIVGDDLAALVNEAHGMWVSEWPA